MINSKIKTSVMVRGQDPAIRIPRFAKTVRLHAFPYMMLRCEEMLIRPASSFEDNLADKEMLVLVSREEVDHSRFAAEWNKRTN